MCVCVCVCVCVCICVCVYRCPAGGQPLPLRRRARCRCRVRLLLLRLLLLLLLLRLRLRLLLLVYGRVLVRLRRVLRLRGVHTRVCLHVALLPGDSLLLPGRRCVHLLLLLLWLVRLLLLLLLLLLRLLLLRLHGGVLLRWPAALFLVFRPGLPRQTAARGEEQGKRWVAVRGNATATGTTEKHMESKRTSIWQARPQ